MRFRLLFAAVLMTLPMAQGQPGPAASNDVELYRQFFGQVVSVGNKSGPVMMNGEPSRFTQPGVRATLTLTEAEAAMLLMLSGACMARVRNVENEIRATTLTARFQNIQAGATSVDVQRRLGRLRDQREQAILEARQKVKTALGEERFGDVDRYVQSKRGVLSFFPPIRVPDEPVVTETPAQTQQ